MGTRQDVYILCFASSFPSVFQTVRETVDCLVCLLWPEHITMYDGSDHRFPLQIAMPFLGSYRLEVIEWNDSS